MTDPTNPQLIEVFGQNDIVNGQFGFNVARVVNGELIIGTSNGNNGSVFNLLVYSLANPASPVFVSNTTINYRFLSDMLVNSTGTAVFVPTNGFFYSGNTIFQRFGDFVSIDLTDPTAPTLGQSLFTNEGQPDGGDMSEFGGTLVNDQIAYVAGLTPGGSNVTNDSGNLQVVNVADPKNMSLITSLTIPDTFNLLDVAVQGNRALVIGTAGTESASFNINGPPGVANNLTLTVLDITDPSNPQILGSTFVTPEEFPYGEAGQKTDVVSLGNGDFAVSDTDANGNPALLVIDPSNPSNMIVGAAQVPSGVHGITVSGDTLYASTSTGLTIYQIQPLVSDPVTITVNLPAGAAANIVAGSFNAPPSQIVTSATGDQLIWDRSFASGNTTYEFTWQTPVSGVTANKVVPIVTGASVVYQDLGMPGKIDLAGSSVTGTSIISVTPLSATVRPGGTATYNVRLTNPTDAQVTYNLTVQDSQGDFSPSYANSVTVPADGVVDVPLTLTAYAFAAAGDDKFTVTADDTIYNSSYTTVIADYNDKASAVLTIAGQPIPAADLTARGVVLSLSPSQGTIGQNTSAAYVIQVTNVGSADDHYDVSVSGLPSGVSASYSTSAYGLEVPPGAGNFRDVVLTLSAPYGSVTPGIYPFTVSAQSVSGSSISGSVSGTLTITSLGVTVSFDKVSGSAGDTFMMTVTNTGSVTDSYDLTLAGPAALVSSLATSKVTLAPGASQTVPIHTGAVDFAVQGSLPLTAAATSTTTAGVQGAAFADLSIPASQGMTAELQPAVPDAFRARHGHVPLDGPQHGQHRGFLQCDDHRGQRTRHGDPGRPGWLAYAVNPHIHFAGPIDRRDRAPGGPCLRRPGDRYCSGQVAYRTREPHRPLPSRS